MLTKYNFSYGLRFQMEKAGKSPKDIEKEIGIPSNTIRNYLSERTEPSGIYKMVELADYFEITIDELLYRQRVEK